MEFAHHHGGVQKEKGVGEAAVYCEVKNQGNACSRDTQILPVLFDDLRVVG